jgi:hypothetical protein
MSGPPIVDPPVVLPAAPPLLFQFFRITATRYGTVFVIAGGTQIDLTPEQCDDFTQRLLDAKPVADGGKEEISVHDGIHIVAHDGVVDVWGVPPMTSAQVDDVVAGIRKTRVVAAKIRAVRESVTTGTPPTPLLTVGD